MAAEKRKREKSFVDIVHEMIEKGQSLPEIKKNLRTLGLNDADTEKLIGILDLKAMPKVSRKIDALTRKKIELFAAAQKDTELRKIRSLMRRSSKGLKEVEERMGNLLAEAMPRKLAIFEARMQSYNDAIAGQKSAKKELQAFFLEINEKGLNRRQKSVLRKAKKFFKELP